MDWMDTTIYIYITDSTNYKSTASGANNLSQSSSLSNTITARRELVTRLGRRLLFPTPLSCLAAMQKSSLQRLCQVKNRHKLQFIFVPGGETFPQKHREDAACGIPDKETIVMTGGRVHNYVTRLESTFIIINIWIIIIICE